MDRESIDLNYGTWEESSQSPRRRNYQIGVSIESLFDQNYPNPFNPVTVLSFTIDREEHVTLAVYDISGRLVRTLVDRRMRAGAYAEEWDGRDQNGNPVASGVYLYRLKTGNRALTRKAILLK